MKRTVQMGSRKGMKTKTMYEVQQQAARPAPKHHAYEEWFIYDWKDRWTGSCFRYKSKQQALIKAVELRMLDEHGNQYRVYRVRVRKT